MSRCLFRAAHYERATGRPSSMSIQVLLRHPGAHCWVLIPGMCVLHTAYHDQDTAGCSSSPGNTRHMRCWFTFCGSWPPTTSLSLASCDTWRKHQITPVPPRAPEPAQPRPPLKPRLPCPVRERLSQGCGGVAWAGPAPGPEALPALRGARGAEVGPRLGPRILVRVLPVSAGVLGGAGCLLAGGARVLAHRTEEGLGPGSGSLWARGATAGRALGWNTALPLRRRGAGALPSG